MADNYLERKMEEYRSGVLSQGARRRLTPSGQRPGALTLPMPELRVFVDSADPKLVRTFAGAGAHVAFCCDEPTKKTDARKLAESSGARFYPMSASKALEMYGEADCVVSRRADGSISLTLGDRHVSVSAEGDGAELLAVLLCGPLKGLSSATVSQETH